MADQVRVSNGFISIGIHAASGALVEIIDEETGENLIKNRCDMNSGSLNLLFEGDKCFFNVAAEVNPNCRPCIHTQEREIRINYLTLANVNSETVSVMATLIYTLDEVAPRMTMKASIKCTSNQPLNVVRFPMLNGIWIGEDWKKNTLVTPVGGGEKVDNPVETLSSIPSSIAWNWQNYEWHHSLGGPCGTKEGDKWVYTSAVGGGCAAEMVDLYGSDGGIVLFCNDQSFGMRTLRIETRGSASPGMNLGFEQPAEGTQWQSKEYVLALHKGDWHEAADLYCAESSENEKMQRSTRSPKWFQESAGLVAHYDFQYQNGEVVHYFDDLPVLYKNALEQGVDTIMLAGWHDGGFDRGFPCYHASELLGGQENLRAGIQQIHQQGGHVLFYINARLCNTAYSKFHTLVEHAAARTKDGQIVLEQYGTDDLTFACMSPQKEAWRETIVKAARYLVHTIGADGLYLDQLSAATPIRGYAAEEDDGWIRGCRMLLSDVRQAVGTDKVLLIQGVSEATGTLCNGMLTSSLSSLHRCGFTSFYRYLHPDQTLVDMMVPRKFCAMRPEPVAMLSTQVMTRTFVEGSLAWIYDLEGDNTFRLDPPQHERLKRVLELRKTWLYRYGCGKYRDEEDITSTGGTVKKFILKNGNVLLACANEKKEPHCIAIQLGWRAKANYISLEQPNVSVELPFEYINDIAQIQMPLSVLSLIHFEREL